MKRRAFNIFTAISLLLCIATALLWARNLEGNDQPVPLETSAYDVSFAIDRSHPDEKPEPTPSPLHPTDPIGPAPLPSRSQAKERLVKLVRETVDPTSWSQNLSGAIIDFNGDQLVVVQTAENQRVIANLLGQLKGDGSEKLQHAFDHTRLGKSKFTGAPLTKVIESISKEVKVQIEVDWRSFHETPVTATSLATIELHQPTPGRAIRSAFRSVTGNDLPIRIDATPKAIRIAFDEARPPDVVTRVYDLQPLPACVSGLDPKRAYTRSEALTALVKQIERDVIHSTRIREVDGQMVVTAPASVQQALVLFLDERDEEAFEGTRIGK